MKGDILKYIADDWFCKCKQERQVTKVDRYAAFRLTMNLLSFSCIPFIIQWKFRETRRGQLMRP